MGPCRLLAALLLAASCAAAVSVTISDPVVAPRIGLGIGVNAGSVVACPVSDPSFEGAASNGDGTHKGISQDGWPWYMSADNAGDTAWTAAVVASPVATGTQAQRITVIQTGIALVQGRADLATASGLYPADGSSSFRVKAKVRVASGSGSVKIGFLNSGWGQVLSPTATSVGSGGWTEVTWTLAPGATALRGVTLRFETAGTYYVDDLVCWDENDYDSGLGLRKSVVDRLKQLKPTMLRLGGLGVNSLTLSQYLAPCWPLSYGPAVGQPDLHLDTFLALCQAVGAVPFITVPPRFLDDATATGASDLSDDLVANHYGHHGDLVDYLGGTSGTTYGALRQANGHGRWDQVFSRIYFELGNEVWGTPDGLWDMHLSGDTGLAWVTRYTTYCQLRMTAMKARPGWRSNMRVGFGGQTPTFFVDHTWGPNYSHTMYPAIKSVCDFATIHMYYGKGASGDSDATVFHGLFGQAQWYQDKIAWMRGEYASDAGGSVPETAVYEGAPVWGAWDELSGSTYDRQVSLGAAVSDLDAYCAANRAGTAWANHFHIGPGGAWGILGAARPWYRKPIFMALQMLDEAVAPAANLVTAAVSGAGTFDDTFNTGLTGIPDLAAYPYRIGGSYATVLINRNLGSAATVTCNFPRPVVTVERRVLTAGSILANNEAGESVVPATTALAGNAASSASVSVPAFSAVILTVSDAVAATVATPPADQSVVAGSTATFSVVAGGSPAYTYQWQRSDDGGGTWSVVGGSTASYTTPVTSLADAGARFRCRITNPVGGATSGAAVLAVTAAAVAPGITSQPAARSVAVGATAHFAVGASGTAVLAYQWQSSPDGTTWSDIAGADAAGYTTPATVLADSGTRFRCRVSNGAGSATSDGALLTVHSGGSSASAGGGGGGGGCGAGAATVLLLGLGLRRRRR